MSPKAEELLAEVLKLDEDDRFLLLDALEVSLVPETPKFSPEFLAEIRRRSAAIDNGTVEFFTWDEVKEAARAAIKDRSQN